MYTNRKNGFSFFLFFFLILIGRFRYFSFFFARKCRLIIHSFQFQLNKRRIVFACRGVIWKFSIKCYSQFLFDWWRNRERRNIEEIFLSFIFHISLSLFFFSYLSLFENIFPARESTRFLSEWVELLAVHSLHLKDVYPSHEKTRTLFLYPIYFGSRAFHEFIPAFQFHCVFDFK